MKKIIAILCVGLALTGCSQKWNDLVHEEVVADITAFAVEGQVSSTITKSKKTIAVVMPAETDLSALTVTAFTLSEPSATCTPAIQTGSVLNLSTPITVTLTTYDKYTWVISASVEEAKPDQPDQPDQPEDPDALKDGPQLYNMSFDHWCKAGLNKLDACYGEDATEEEKAVWGSANETTEAMGYPTVGPEETFVAVQGEGKKAAKLTTQGMDLLFGMIKKLAAGSLFTGRTGEIDIAKMSAKIYWGVPFQHRPKVLEGYACYKPGVIDWTEEPYKDLEGKSDTGYIQVLLTDWDEPFQVSPPDSFVDYEKDPHIIGYGKVEFDKSMDAYEKFSIKIDYRNERTPKYVVIVGSSSARGDYFTGAHGSVLYLDELKFWY